MQYAINRRLRRGKIVRVKSPKVINIRDNAKVERPHRTDDIEFYQLLSYTGDVNLNQPFACWKKV